MPQWYRALSHIGVCFMNGTAAAFTCACCASISSGIALRHTFADAIATREYGWDHGLGEIVTALIEAGLRSRPPDHVAPGWDLAGYVNC